MERHGSVATLAPGGRVRQGEGGSVTRTRQQDATCTGNRPRCWSTKEATSRRAEMRERDRNGPSADLDQTVQTCHSSAGLPCPIFVSKHLSALDKHYGPVSHVYVG